MRASQRRDWWCLRPGDAGAHFTHGASLLHLHTSGQMRETYGFRTCRSIPSKFFFVHYKISLPLSLDWKYYRATRTAPRRRVHPAEHAFKRVLLFVSVLLCFFLESKREFKGGKSGSDRELGVYDKACERVRSVSQQSVIQFNVSAELQLSPPRLLRFAR